uniref:DM13 domain-containing protein n=1 Tax=Panagrolaimus superbus TaxID=310955 RepID=A0A914YJQ0_9BILA
MNKLLHYCFGLLIFYNSILIRANAVAPINPAFTAPSSGQRHSSMVLPWSAYREKLEKEKLKSGNDPNKPVTLLLKPPFKDVFQRKSLNDKTLLETQRNTIIAHKPTTLPTNQVTVSNHAPPSTIKFPPSSRPAGFSYSTNTFREQLSNNNRTYSPISRPPTTLTSNPQPFHHHHRDAAGIPLSQITIPHRTPIIPTINQVAAPTQFGNLAPASPFPLSNFGPQPENIANSIFSQSQLRYAPQTMPSFGQISPQAPNFGSELYGGPPPAAATGGNAISENAFGNLNPFQFLSNARDSPVEQIARIAKNLLSHENQELFGNLLGAAKASSQSLTSNAVKKGVEFGSSSAIEPAATLISSSASKDNKEIERDAKLHLTQKDLENAIKGATTDEEKNLLELAVKDIAATNDTSTTLKPHTPEINLPKIVKTENELQTWINQNRPKNTSKEVSVLKKIFNAQDLPYYGRYCGVFAENFNSSRNYEIGGALWVVDNRHFIVSKFHFKPISGSDNITFWAGPKIVTGNNAKDFLPSKNGFHLKPVPIDIQTFIVKDVKVFNATIRHSIPINASIAEAEDDSRNKRDLFSHHYEENIPFKVSANFGNQKTIKSESSSDGNKDFFENSTATITTKDISVDSATTNLPTTTSGKITTSTTHTAITVSNGFNQKDIVPLEWYAGFQPMLLTLPEDQEVKTTHWVSIYDHNRQEPVSFILIPNGNAFQIPSTVQLRPFVASGSYKLKSGPIHIKDTKTIEISEFSLQTQGIPVWFMIGKEVVPNSNGHIVPVFDKVKNKFDCMSLRDYHNETVILRLPGVLDIRDVFWFSIFSIPQSLSMSHIYLPYNDMHLPPDLDGRSSPICEWSPVH